MVAWVVVGGMSSSATAGEFEAWAEGPVQWLLLPDERKGVKQVDSTAEQYTILKVAEDTRVITLDRAYEGTTAGTASYSIKDLRDPSQVYCSEPFLPNLWPARNNPTR